MSVTIQQVLVRFSVRKNYMRLNIKSDLYFKISTCKLLANNLASARFTDDICQIQTKFSLTCVLTKQ